MRTWEEVMHVSPRTKLLKHAWELCRSLACLHVASREHSSRYASAQEVAIVEKSVENVVQCDKLCVSRW